MGTLRALEMIVASVGLSACVRASVMPLSANTFELTASGAPVCHTAGTQSVVVHDAAIETIRRGYDLFVIEGAQQQNEAVGVYQAPTMASSYGAATVVGGPGFATGFGTSTTTFSGGFSSVIRKHRQEIVVRMFRNGDSGAENAMSARQLLGPGWQKAAAGGLKETCL